METNSWGWVIDYIHDARYCTALIPLVEDGTLSFDQLETAARIVGDEREKYPTENEKNEAAEKKTQEILDAIQACNTETEIIKALYRFEDQRIEDMGTEIRNGTKLLELFCRKELSIDQLERAAAIVGKERQRFSDREQQDEAADIMSGELVTALKACRTEEEKEVVLDSYKTE